MSFAKEPRGERLGPVPQSHKRSLDLPMEKQTFDKGRVEVVTVGEMTIGRFVFEPGWRWSQSVKSIVKTGSCKIHHVGYVISGRLEVVMDGGKELELGPGDVYEVFPGHDAVVGKESFVALEIKSAAKYAKPNECTSAKEI